jgi:uncharacterized membrane protein YfcA
MTGSSDAVAALAIGGLQLGWESVAAGVLVGLSMGLTGGGGAIFAVPMLVYWIGVGPRAAVGVSLLTVALTAVVGVVERLRHGHVEIRTGLLLAVAGMLTAPLGTWLGGLIPGPVLLVSFAVLMLGIAHVMWHKASVPAVRQMPSDLQPGCSETARGPACSRDPEGKLRLTSRCARLLALVGLVVGLLSGLFGVGGGFLIVPSLVTFAMMDLSMAVGTSLLVITLVGGSGVASEILSGREIPLDVTLGFLTGSIPGLFAGSFIGRQLPGPLVARIFSVTIVCVAAFVILKTVAGW